VQSPVLASSFAKIPAMGLDDAFSGSNGVNTTQNPGFETGNADNWTGRHRPVRRGVVVGSLHHYLTLRLTLRLQATEMEPSGGIRQD